jgi:hypothetical protein
VGFTAGLYDAWIRTVVVLPVVRLAVLILIFRVQSVCVSPENILLSSTSVGH